MAGKSIRDNAFRSRFHAAVVAIKRNGMPLQWSGQQIGDEVLKVGAVPAVHAAPAVICCDWQAARQGGSHGTATSQKHLTQVHSCLTLPPRLRACAPRCHCVPACCQAGDHLLLDVAPQFWTAPEVNACFVDITKGGQVGGWGSSSTLLLILPLPLPLLQRLPALLFTATAT